jgi:hypothetical protein
MKKVKILLTFDYELPLGSVKDYQVGLFKPADRLIKLANEVKVPIILFVDICSAIQFEKWENSNYYVPFKDQVQGALRDGHDVQLHIHPHWMNSSFVDKRFIPSTNFSLSSFNHDIDGYSIEQIIEEAFWRLTDMGREVKSDYQCIAFRAGGYDVEPESKRILNKLFDLGIRIESSVIKDFYLDYSFSKIDYSKTPTSSFWFISKDGPLTTASQEGLLELPISSKPTGLRDLLGRRIKKTFNKGVFKSRLYNNSGTGYLAISGKQNLRSKYRSITNPTVLTFDREYRDVQDLESIVSHNVKKYEDEKSDLYLTVIAHPKSMGEYHLGLMKSFIDRMRKIYGDQVEFITYRHVQRDFDL